MEFAYKFMAMLSYHLLCLEWIDNVFVGGKYTFPIHYRYVPYKICRQPLIIVTAPRVDKWSPWSPLF